MALDRYFREDDGSLPEIELCFGSPEQLSAALAYLFELGAVNVTEGGARVWVVATNSDRPFSGPADAALVADGTLAPAHVVLGAVAPRGLE